MRWLRRFKGASPAVQWGLMGALLAATFLVWALPWMAPYSAVASSRMADEFRLLLMLLWALFALLIVSSVMTLVSWLLARRRTSQDADEPHEGAGEHDG